MSALDDIKARAEKAAEARCNYDGEADSESIMLAFIAEESSYDVPPLVAALEALEERLKFLDAVQAESSDEQYNRNAGGTAAILRLAINEALEGAA